MKPIILETINRFYKKENLAEYLARCEQKWIIPVQMEQYTNKNDIHVSNADSDDIWPSVELFFEYPVFEKGEFSVQYSSTLMISKLAPIYYVQHEFEVDNVDPNYMSPTLDGFDVQPYCNIQYFLELEINSWMTQLGYEKLDYAEISEVICNLRFKDEKPLFGEQVTVEYALFFDLLEVCPDK